MRRRCRACGGVYDDVDRDGVLYFHVCSRVTVLMVDLGPTGVVQDARSAFRGVALVESAQAKQDLIDAGTAADEIGVVLGRRTVQRSDHRDENTARREGARGETRVVKSEGAGAEDAPAALVDRER